jgi:hypothetical protein
MPRVHIHNNWAAVDIMISPLDLKTMVVWLMDLLEQQRRQGLG